MAKQSNNSIADLKVNVLEEKRTLLCNNLDPKTHYPFFRSKFLLSEEDEEMIERKETRKQRVHKFLDLLVKKGPTGFDVLVKSILLEGTQTFLAAELNKCFEEKERRLSALLRNSMTCHPVIPASCSNGVEYKVISNSPQVQTNYSRVSSSEGKVDSLPDLGIKTELLPKPVMVKAEHKGKVKDNNENDLSDIKSVEENDEKEGSSDDLNEEKELNSLELNIKPCSKDSNA